jgi:hypothetical protein
LYGNRTEMRVELAQMFGTMGFMHFERDETDQAIKCFEESISLIEEDHEWAMDVQSMFLDLAVCYAKIGQKAKSFDLIRKAYTLEMCVDIEHFKTLNSRAKKIPFFDEALKTM